MSGVQFAGFPDTRQRIAHPTPKPSFRAISQTNVSSRARYQGYGRAGLFEYEYRVARTGEAGEKAFPAGAVGKHEQGMTASGKIR